MWCSTDSITVATRKGCAKQAECTCNISKNFLIRYDKVCKCTGLYKSALPNLKKFLIRYDKLCKCTTLCKSALPNLKKFLIRYDKLCKIDNQVFAHASNQC